MQTRSRLLTLADLDSVELPPVPLAVLGDPVGHSLSPAMHRAALAALASEEASFGDWAYLALHVPVELLPEALEQLRARGFRGLNLTIPHKVRAVELVASMTAEAAAAGAVNTLLPTPEGWRGMNTDGPGIATAVRATAGRELGDGPVVLCGAGGAARAIAVEVLKAGTPALWLGNRSAPNLERLLVQLSRAGIATDNVHPFLFALPPKDLPGDALVINATAAGLRKEDRVPLELAFLGAGGAIYDTTYGAPNQWAAAADRVGVPYGDGLFMLAAQGALSLEAWTGRPVSAALMEAAAREALKQRSLAS